ncbi:MAG: hypothetical protein OEY06_11430 [Gammaproteobacteria bacterium]|nr:hypothetical protein [Gammaproteobacteria bacterium]
MSANGAGGDRKKEPLVKRVILTGLIRDTWVQPGILHDMRQKWKGVRQ